MTPLPITGEYPDDWGRIATRAKDQAAWRCVRCHHPFRTNLRATDRAYSQPCDDRCDHSRGLHAPHLSLTVHHLDGDKGNSAWWNLLVLCNSCHLSIQAKVLPDRPYLWEHSDWFRPYAAGFYAHYYGNERLGCLLDYPARTSWREKETARCLRLGQPWLYPPAPPAEHADG